MSKALKVGFTYVYDEKKKEKRKLSYIDVKYDIDEWVDANKFLPADFDLVYLKVLNHIRKISAWSVGKNWEGIHFRPEYKVLFWKKHEEF